MLTSILVVIIVQMEHKTYQLQTFMVKQQAQLVDATSLTIKQVVQAIHMVKLHYIKMANIVKAHMAKVA